MERTDERRRIATETRRRELDVIRRSDITLVVSPVERAELAKVVPDARVEVLSNIHEVQTVETLPFAARQGILFIGGFKHHPNVDGIQWFIREIWPLVRSSLPGATVEVVGSHMPNYLLALEVPGVSMRGFVEDLAPILKTVRVSVAPLRYGAGVKGKVNQAMAWGIPVVATPVAVEGMSLREGLDVFVAKNASDFAGAVVRLYKDEALWNRLAEGGRENVRRNFSPEVAMRSLETVLDFAR
jgi:glycosyltransferase involved in cell wall biosynthesis